MSPRRGTSFDATSWPADAPFLRWPVGKACCDPDVPDAYLIEASPAPGFSRSAAMRMLDRPVRTQAMRDYLVEMVVNPPAYTGSTRRLVMGLSSVRAKVVDVLLGDPDTSRFQLFRLADNVNAVNKVWANRSGAGPVDLAVQLTSHRNAGPEAVIALICDPSTGRHRGWVNRVLWAAVDAGQMVPLVLAEHRPAPPAVPGVAHVRVLLDATLHLEKAIPSQPRAAVVDMLPTWAGSATALVDALVDASTAP